MKIGIITIHRANNYGAALQCYALQRSLEALHYEVQVIDYRQPDTEEAYQPVSISRICKESHSLMQLLKDLFLIPLRYRNARGFNKFRNKYLNCTSPIYRKEDIPQDFDVYLLGSDQLWSVLCTGNNVEEVFWGNFKHSPRSVINGYAISGTISSLETIGKNRVKKFLENFCQLSCREKDIAAWIQNNTGYKCRVDIDPTLLVDDAVWQDLEKTNKKTFIPYLLSYYLLPEQKAIVKNYAKKAGLKYVELGYIASSPTDFLTLIKNASIIVGGSFHLAVFSIIFRKQFYIIRKESDSDIRSEHLLKQLNLQERMISISTFLTITHNTKICYDGINEKLAILKGKSMEYLASFKIKYNQTINEPSQ
jgi:hypothetical protein